MKENLSFQILFYKAYFLFYGGGTRDRTETSPACKAGVLAS
jgi:hypothetical protein